MKIPKSFQVLDHNIKVEFVDELVNQPDDEEAVVLGEALYLQQKIHILKENPEQHSRTFWHETVHHILHVLGYHELNDSEQLIDQLGRCLNQVYCTMDYGNKKS